MPSSPAQPRASSPASEYRIFAGITYHLASSLPPTRAEELAFVLDAHGGQAADKELGVKDPKLTTVVSNSVRFEGWEVVAARMEGQGGGEGGNGDGKVVEVVTDKWVERSIVLGKLQSGSHFSADPSLIFSGVVACASDLPAADLEVLSAGITALGGQWRTGLTKDVTHLFALNPGSAKYATAMHYREETGIRVVLPHWFDDAVRLGMGGLDTRPYEWPEPALLRGPAPPGGDGKEKPKGKEKDIPDVEKDDVKRNMYATAALFTLSMNRSSPPTEADISLVNNGVHGNVNGSVNGTPGPSSVKSGVQVWTDRKILLSRTLQLYGNRREAVQKGIERAGGIVLRFEGDEEEDENSSGDWNVKLSRQEKVRRRHEAERVDECDIFVTRWRWGKAYVQAVKGGKTIGTLAWLFHVQSTGILARPLDQLLHYPVPKRPIEGFSHHTITVTNYTGEAREYLKKLITAMGAHFTPSMSGQNTALIAAYIKGTKANKALSWSIPVVNHTWLEDCFIQWRNLTVAREKYIVFPAGVDFSELLGERSLTAGASSGGGVANRIELEGEALEELIGEEGEEDVDEEEGALKAPNGTEGSAKEVARGLVDIDEDGDAVMSKPNSKPTSKPKSNGRAPIRPPPGMDIDFAPPSTALAAAEMDWEHSHMEDMVQDYNRQMPLPVEGGEEERPKSKATPNAKTKESPRKPTHQPPKTTPKAKPKPKDDAIELEDSSEDEEVPKKKTKGKGKKPPEDEDSDEELPRAKSKAKGKSKAIESEEEDVDEEPKLKSRSKPSPKSKSKFKAIELSDEEEAPKAKSKAKAKAVASDYEEEEEDEEEEAPKKTKGRGKAKVVDSDDEVEELAVKPRSKPTPKSKAKATESEDEPAAESRPKPTRKGKSKAKATSESEEEEEEPAVSKAHSKATPRGKVKAAEDSDEDDEEEEVPVKSKSRTKPSPKSKTKKFIDDAAYGEDEDEDEEDEEESTKAKSKSKKTSSPKSKSKTKAKAPTPTPSASETSEDEAPARKPTKAAAKASVSKPAPAKGKGKKTLPSSSSESESAVIVPAKQTKKLVRRFTGELGGAKAKGGDEGAEVEDARVKAKEAGGSGLLKTTRGDARTRVRKKKVVVEVESEEEEEPVVETKSKAKAKAVDKGKAKDAKGKKYVAVSSDEEEEPATAKAKAKGKAKATAEKPKSKGGATTPSRSKPLRVYSTDEEGSDDEDEAPATKKGKKAEPVEDEEDSDISFPDAPWQTAKPAQEKENTGPSSKAKKMKGKGKIASNEEEEEPAPVKKASTSRPRKATKEAAATAPPATALTPKRTVSVLMPSLSMSGKEREKRKRATEAFLAEQEEEHEEERAGKKAKATSKLKSKGANTNATTVAPKGKAAAAKAKDKPKSPIEPESEDEDEEAEVSILVSPSIRPKNLAKTNSLHAVAGHVVSSSVAKAAAKDKEKAKPNGRATKEKEKLETSISVSRKPAPSKPKSKVKAVPIEIDTSSAGAGPSTAGPSAFETESVVSTGPPKRSAAAKATQRLHDKLMPDLINFEAQMKKSRGRKSAGGDMGLGSFAFDGDGDVKQEKDSGKRRKSEAADAGDEEKVRKKRRVSDENDEADKEKTKGKGKQKAGVDKDGDVEMVDGDAAKPSKTAKGKKKDEPEETASNGVVLLTTQVTLSDEVLKALGKLGVKITSRPSECTHLLAPHLVRTEKFLCALAVAPYVLTGQWAIASAAAKKLLPEKDFLLKDKAGESKYGVDLSLSLKRAKANTGKLLEGKTFYVTPHVQIDKKLFKSVVTACGGQVSPNQPTARVLAPSPDNRIVISCKEDISIWRPIRSAGYKVYTQELVLAGVLKQEMEWDREDFLVEG